MNDSSRDFPIEVNSTSFGVNDALLDWKILRGAERPFTRLSSLSDLLCLFSVVEAVAIYDTLWVSPADIEFFDALKPLVDAEIVRDCKSVPDKLNDRAVEQEFKNVASMLRYGEMARLSEVGAIDEASEPTFARYLFASNHRIDSVLDPIYTSYVPLVKQNSSRSLASRLSQSLSAAYRKQIEQLVEGGAPIAFYIPPAPAVILDRSSGNRDRVIKELLTIRQEFAAFRAKYRAYQNIIRRPDKHTPKEMSDAIREGLHEIESAIEALDTQRTGSRLIADMFDVDVSGSDDGLSISKPFGSLIKGIWSATNTRLVRGRAQCLFDLWQTATNVRGYDTMLQRHFDLEETALEDDVELAQQLGMWVDKQAGIKRRTEGSDGSNNQSPS